MALHPNLPRSPYAELDPAHRWFSADEALRSSAYERLLLPLVARVRAEVETWRDSGYANTSRNEGFFETLESLRSDRSG